MPDSVFFVGDSHVGCIARAALEQGLHVLGGPFATGGDWGRGNFELDASGIRFDDAVSQQLFEKELKRAGVASLYDLKIPLVTTCGFHVMNGINEIREYWVGGRAPAGRIFLTDAVFAEVVRTVRRKHLEFIKRLCDAGIRVVGVPSPPRLDRTRKDIAIGFEEQVFATLTGYGVDFIRPREFACDGDGSFKLEYASETDRTHANVAYGHEIVKRLRKLLFPGGSAETEEPATTAANDDMGFVAERERRRQARRPRPQ